MSFLKSSSPMCNFTYWMESSREGDYQEKLKKYHPATSIWRSMKYTKSKPLKTFNKKKSYSPLMLLLRWKNINNSYRPCTMISAKLFLRETSLKKCGNLQRQNLEHQRSAPKPKTSSNLKFILRRSGTEKTWEN